MKKLFIISIFSLFVSDSFGCCGAFKSRLFPIGSSNGKIVVATFKMYRKCSKNLGFKQFEWNGITELAYYQGDSLQLIEIVDTFSFSQTNYSDSSNNLLKQFYDSILPIYNKVFTKASVSLEKFIPAFPEKYTNYNDVRESEKEFTLNDSILKSNGKFILNVNNKKLCDINTEIIDTRSYYILNKRVYVLSFSCDNNRFYKKMKPTNNSSNFKVITKGYTVNIVQWHSWIKDYITIEEL